jgi:hypothetical protein
MYNSCIYLVQSSTYPFFAIKYHYNFLFYFLAVNMGWNQEKRQIYPPLSTHRAKVSRFLLAITLLAFFLGYIFSMC